MQNSTMIAEYAANLLNHIKQTTAECKAPESKAVVCKAQAWRDRLTPLDVRLEKILAEIPPEVQAEGLSLHALQKFVTGRRNANAHPGELGAALRHLGWHRTRQWRGDETGFRALWFPASTTSST